MIVLLAAQASRYDCRSSASSLGDDSSIFCRLNLTPEEDERTVRIRDVSIDAFDTKKTKSLLPRIGVTKRAGNLHSTFYNYWPLLPTTTNSSTSNGTSDALTVVLNPAVDDFRETLGAKTDENRKEFAKRVTRMVMDAIDVPLKAMKAKGFASWHEFVTRMKELGGPSAFFRRVHIVIDEAQQHELLVRWLCRWRQSVVESLCSTGGVFAGIEKENVYFMCAGVGLSAPLCEDMATDATSFLVIPLKKQVLWKDLCMKSRLAPDALQRMLALVKAAEEHPWLLLLEENARVATLCFTELLKLSKLIVGDDLRTAEAKLAIQARAAVFGSAHHLFDAVAKEVRARNCLKNVSDAKIVQIAQAAFRLVLCGVPSIG